MLQIALNQLVVPVGNAVALSTLISSMEPAAGMHPKSRILKGYDASASSETLSFDIYNFTGPSTALAGSTSFIADQLTDLPATECAMISTPH